VIVLSACLGGEDEENLIYDRGDQYFPLQKGYYRIYDVEDTEYFLVGAPVTSRYYIKELLADSVLNQQQEISWILERYRKENEMETWKLDSIWTVRKTERNLIVDPGNRPLVKLIYPVKPGSAWDGNAFNGMETDEYLFKEVKRNVEVCNSIFEETIMVEQENNPDTLLRRDKRLEIFAKNVGMIYKETVLLKYCQEIECLGQGQIDYGRIYRACLVKFGNE
jgi:hypothetical protein